MPNLHMSFWFFFALEYHFCLLLFRHNCGRLHYFCLRSVSAPYWLNYIQLIARPWRPLRAAFTIRIYGRNKRINVVGDMVL